MSQVCPHPEMTLDVCHDIQLHKPTIMHKCAQMYGMRVFYVNHIQMCPVHIYQVHHVYNVHDVHMCHVYRKQMYHADMHIYYTKSSFPKRIQQQSKNCGSNGNARFGDHDLEKTSS